MEGDTNNSSGSEMRHRGGAAGGVARTPSLRENFLERNGSARERSASRRRLPRAGGEMEIVTPAVSTPPPRPPSKADSPSSEALLPLQGSSRTAGFGGGGPAPTGAMPSAASEPSGSPMCRQYGARHNVFIRAVATVWIATTVFLGLACTFLLQLLLWVFLFWLFIPWPVTRYKLLGWIFHHFNTVCAFFLNPFWRVEVVRPLPKHYVPRKALLMFNHTSSLDPWLAARSLFPRELKFVYKKDLQKVPLAGWALYLSGDLSLEFTKEQGGWKTAPGSVDRMMRKAEFMFNHGIPQAIFPEGTRSRSGRLQPFRQGFFRFAVEHNAEIVPVVMHNCQSLWPLGSRLFDCGTAYLIYGDPTQPREGETAEELSDRIRNHMIDLYKYSPEYHPERDAPLNERPRHRGLGIAGR